MCDPLCCKHSLTWWPKSAMAQLRTSPLISLNAARIFSLRSSMSCGSSWYTKSFTYPQNHKITCCEVWRPKCAGHEIGPLHPNQRPLNILSKSSGFASDQNLQLWQLTSPLMWKLASSVNNKLRRKLSSLSSKKTTFSQKTTRCSSSSSDNYCWKRCGRCGCILSSCVRILCMTLFDKHNRCDPRRMML